MSCFTPFNPHVLHCCAYARWFGTMWRICAFLTFIDRYRLWRLRQVDHNSCLRRRAVAADTGQGLDWTSLTNSIQWPSPNWSPSRQEAVFLELQGKILSDRKALTRSLNWKRTLPSLKHNTNRRWVNCIKKLNDWWKKTEASTNCVSVNWFVCCNHRSEF